ncbi:MAG: 30S ribosomal protein S2 [Candidatus Micrarchaeia archaeon]
MAEEKDEKSNMLVKQERYLEAGIHIGTKMHTYDMGRYIFKTRDDGLHILNLRETDARLRQTAKLIGRYKPEDVLVVASRTYSGNAASKFSALTGVSLNRGRFIPGTLTNIALPNFREPKLIFVCDPKNEHEAVMEATKVGVPVVALCDTDNETKFLDYVIPANNKGRKSLALIFFILTRELMMSQGKIASYDQFQYEPSYFEELEDFKKVAPKPESAPEQPAAPEAKPAPASV